MKKILIVFGTRPEAIKMVPVIRALKNKPEIFDTRICVTAQHREMLDQVLNFFDIKPEFDLNLMQPGQSLNQITARVLTEIKPVFDSWKPDAMLVHGDTTTTMASSLAAFYERIPVGHVEAGLRSFHKYSPFPEEINREITTRVATWHFAPTAWARENLLREHIEDTAIAVTGNTVVDALLLGLEKLKTFEPARFDELSAKLDANKAMILVTAHRRENFGEGFENMCQALLELSLRDSVQIVIPVHLNPNVREVVSRVLGKAENILLIEPQPYEMFLFLMNRSFLILTDSGGIQEEAPSLGKPVLVMRDTTERPEGVDSGVVKLVGTSKENIVREVSRLLDDPAWYTGMSEKPNPFGDGTAGEQIASFLAAQFDHA